MACRPLRGLSLLFDPWRLVPVGGLGGFWCVWWFLVFRSLGSRVTLVANSASGPKRHFFMIDGYIDGYQWSR